MFSTKEYLRKRTPQNGTDRENYLSLLVDEYLNSTSHEAKCQVLANLANFAYDPINYSYIRDVGVLDIFLHVIKNETNAVLLRFAIAGICNLCLDPLNADYIKKHLGLKPVIKLLQSDDTESVADAITTLIYLYDDETKSNIIDEKVIKTMVSLKNTDKTELVNLATVFLQHVSSSN